MYTSSEVRGDDQRYLLRKTELAKIGCPFIFPSHFPAGLVVPID